MLHPADKRREGGGGRSLHIVLWLVLLVLGVLDLDGIGVLAPLKGQALQLLTPAQRGLTRGREGINGAWENLGGADALREETAALKQQLGQLETENLRLRGLEVENDR